MAALINVVVWCRSAWLLGKRGVHLSAPVRAMQQRLMWLSAVYVIGCAFRSVFPMVDVPRICLHDTALSRIFVGRLVATVAELCFVAQWALLLREAGSVAGCRLATNASRILLPMIVVAEIFSWGAVLTANYLLHATENALWALAAIGVVTAFIAVRPDVDERARRLLITAIGCGMLYIAFMVIVDVPMYLTRWQAGVTARHEYLSLHDGLSELLQRCVVTHNWSAWRDDVPWLSLYFTVAVWISIALAHVPPLQRARCH